MKNCIVLCAVCLYVGGSYGVETDGVGAFSYQDSSGKRYGGTYGLRDGQVVNKEGNLPPNFSPPNFPDLDDFFPDYFNNFENVLQDAIPFIVPPSLTRQPLFRKMLSKPFFKRAIPFIFTPSFIRPPPFSRTFYKPFFQRTFDNEENQRRAYDAATKAFDLTSNRAGYNPNFTPSGFPFGSNFQGFGGFPGAQGFGGFPGAQGFAGRQGFSSFDMPNFGPSANSAYAGAALTPEYKHQVESINPANPNNPNINKFSSVSSNPGGYKSVSTHASSSSSNIDGKTTSSRQAETIVNDNGVITKYKLNS